METGNKTQNDFTKAYKILVCLGTKLKAPGGLTGMKQSLLCFAFLPLFHRAFNSNNFF